LSCQKFASALVTILLVNAFIACSGSPQRTIVQPTITASISPTTVALGPGGVQSFTATVQNTSDTDVMWYVNQVNGGSSSTGTITSTGEYTAPTVTSQTVFTVTAVADANTSITASAAVTVTPLTGVINVSVNPRTANVVIATTWPFGAVVTGTSNTAVTWSISGTGSECSGGGSPCGTIDSSGVYTAPSTVPTPATVTVTATSQADGTTTGTATVTVVVSSLGVTISPPGSVGVAYSGQRQFNATVVGSSNPAVKWALVCIADGEAPSPPNFPDCAGDAEGDGNPDAETNAIPVADQTATSAIFFAATGPDQGSTYTLSLTATTVAVDGQGHTASATVTICVNATGMVNSGGTCP